jgi:cystathionine beta-lyase/cystathionine gamma-synthase
VLHLNPVLFAEIVILIFVPTAANHGNHRANNPAKQKKLEETANNILNSITTVTGVTVYGLLSVIGHPNAELLAEKCRELHGAPRAAIAASGMGALALALVSQCRQGDHIVAGSQMYGRSLLLFNEEARRLGIETTTVDTCDSKATAAAFTSATKLLVVETITNPLLRVADLRELAELAHRRGARLLVDNTLASPVLCRPLELGADLVLESLTKIMNGHSDVLLGLLCGREEAWERVPTALSTWGWSAAPLAGGPRNWHTALAGGSRVANALPRQF